MARHLLVGKMGTADRVGISADTGEVLTEVKLVDTGNRLECGIGDAIDDACKLQTFPSEIGVDLLILAALVYAADTRISRERESQDNWTRELRIVVPVSDVRRWESSSAILKKMLGFLTGDIWTIQFRKRPAQFATTVSRPSRSRNVFECKQINLFSGGLDSLIGAIDSIEAGITPLFVSHAGEGASSAAQSACFEELKKAFTKAKLSRLRLWTSFPQNLVLGTKKDDSTRGRSFLFFSLAVFAASATVGFRLCVSENGLIALNVPLDPLRLGSLSTRTTHPYYIARWEELLEVLGLEGKIENPYWNKTKGEMIKDCKNRALLYEILPISMSCSSPSKGRWKKRGIEHCGYCTPCIIRRAAIAKGFGRKPDPTPYTLTDLQGTSLDTGKAEGQQIRSFKLAVQRLADNEGLAKILIHKPGPLTDVPDELEGLASVYVRGMLEVGQLLDGVEAAPA